MSVLASGGARRPIQGMAGHRRDARCVELVMGIEMVGRGDQAVFIPDTVTQESRAHPFFAQPFSHGGTQAADDVVFLHRHN